MSPLQIQKMLLFWLIIANLFWQTEVLGASGQAEKIICSFEISQLWNGDSLIIQIRDAELDSPSQSFDPTDSLWQFPDGKSLADSPNLNNFRVSFKEFNNDVAKGLAIEFHIVNRFLSNNLTTTSRVFFGHDHSLRFYLEHWFGPRRDNIGAAMQSQDDFKQGSFYDVTNAGVLLTGSCYYKIIND